MYARLERWSVGSEAFSESLMLRRRALFDVEKGFETRRKATEALDKLLYYWQRCARDRNNLEFRGWKHILLLLNSSRVWDESNRFWGFEI